MHGSYDLGGVTASELCRGHVFVLAIFVWVRLLGSTCVGVFGRFGGRTLAAYCIVDCKKISRSSEIG